MIKNKNLKAIIIIIIVIYIATYYVSLSGYYEYHIQEKTILTNQKIKEFEEDVKNNQSINIKNYLDIEEVDYSNKITNLIYDFSLTGNKITKKIIKIIFKKLSYLIEE